jgi:hypothetical protein
MYSVPQRALGGGNRLSRRTIADLYGELVRWRHEIHPDLRISATRATEMEFSALRALSFLDLRFQYATMSVTRPLLFRLVSSLRNGTFGSLSNDTQLFITTYSDACSQSARSSLQTLKFMHQRNLLNNVLWLDTFYILSTTMVLLLEYLRTASLSEAHHINDAISILKELHPRGTSRLVLASLTDLQAFLGLGDLPPPDPAAGTEHPQSSTAELHLYELFNSPSPSTGISSPEISVPGGYVGIPTAGEGGQEGSTGLEGYGWMDQIVRLAYAEFGQS